MPNQINEVTYTIDAQAEPGRFTIPKKVRTALDIDEDEYPPLYITIQDAVTEEELLPKELHYMTSGPEILDSRTRTVIKSHQLIRVTVSRAD